MSSENNSINILKSRDDPQPVVFKKIEEDKFQLHSEIPCSWVKQEDKFGPDILRPRIEPWLTALFQSEHLSLLCGSVIPCNSSDDQQEQLFFYG